MAHFTVVVTCYRYEPVHDNTNKTPHTVLDVEISAFALTQCNQSSLYAYSQTCVKQPYKTRFFSSFQTSGCLLLHERSAEGFLHCRRLSALLSFSNKQPPVNSDFYVI